MWVYSSKGSQKSELLPFRLVSGSLFAMILHDHEMVRLRIGIQLPKICV